MATAVQQFCLRWNNHQPNFISVFTHLLSNECLVDVTLAAEGKQLQAHKVVLSACSSYFQALFTTNPCQHPIVILKDIKFSDLKTMVDFMYYGEVNVSQDQLPAILKTAETLKIKGLADMPEQLSLSKSTSQPSTDKCDTPSPISPSVLRRKRLRKSSTGSGSEQTSEDTPASGSGSTEIPHSPLKPDPDAEGPSPSNYGAGSLRQEPSTDSEHRDSSHSFEDAEFSSRHVSQEETPESNIKWSCSEENRPGSGAQTSQPLTPHVVEPPAIVSSMGSKRGRLLMRQPRIKKESEVSIVEPTNSGSEMILGVADLTSLGVGSSAVECYGRIERQHSEPTPNLLSVPQHSYLIKQNSSPHLTTPVPSSSIQSSSTQASPSTTPSTSAVTAIPTGSASSQSQVTATSTEIPIPAPLPKIKIEELRRVITGSQNSSTTTLSSVLDPNEAARACHCPVLRPGPALGCNYCWNTIDNHGRILRRKTKYHCPECQTNLCIVPCFQEFHEKHPTSSAGSKEGPSSCNTGSQAQTNKCKKLGEIKTTRRRNTYTYTLFL